MKKLSMLVIAVILFAIGCGKKEEPEPSTNNAPVITLVGNLKDTISLNATYNDPGFAAVDDVDGNITTNVAVTGSVNVNLEGDYVKKYNVSDADGNNANEVLRMVHVRNEAWFLAGNYAVMPNCGSTPSSNYTNTISVSNTLNRRFTVSDLLYNNTGSALQGSLGVGNSTFVITTVPINASTFNASGSVTTPGKLQINSYSKQGAMTYYYCNSIMIKQ